MICDPKVWRDTLRRLQRDIPEFAFAAWIRPLDVKIADDRIVVGCPSSFHRDRVRIHYHDLLEKHFRSVLQLAENRARAHTEEGTHDPSGKPSGKSADSPSDPDRRPTIELVCLNDFAKRPGHRIEFSALQTSDDTDSLETSHAFEAADLEALEAAQEHGVVEHGGRGLRPLRSVSTRTAARPVAIGGGTTDRRLALRPTAGEAGHAGGAVAVSRAAQASRAGNGSNASDLSDAVDASDASDASDTSGPSERAQGAHLASVPDRVTRLDSHGSGTRGVAGLAQAGSNRSGVNRKSGRGGERASERGELVQPELPFSFESFVVGPCNALAREAALALARTRQRSLNLLYLGGESGMGKTHLARATTAEARRGIHGDRPGIVYTSAEKFTTDFVSAMRNGRSEEFKRRYRGSIGLLVVEDVQGFHGRVKTQLELFHTVQHVLDAGGRVLLTGDRSPRELTGLDERVRAQVGRGFVAELEPPDAMVRRHILRAKAAAGGVRLPEDCLDLLVEASQGSVRDIESLLIQVVTTSSLLGREINLDLTQDAVALKSRPSSVLQPRTVAVSEIVRIVAAFFGKRPEALASRSRRRDVLVPRQLAMYLAHRYTNASFAEIGRGLGRGHPSVRNAVERIERQVLENAPIRYQVEALSERVDQTLKETQR